MQTPSQNHRTPPRLAPPGAGIPLYQRLLGKIIFTQWVAPRTPWEKSDQEFAMHGERIIARCKTLSPDQLFDQALIPPMPMLEDSSRFWSVAMTLEHLMIAGRGMGAIVVELSDDSPDSIGRPLPTVSTAQVKPKALQTEAQAAAILAEFETFQANHLKQINAAVDNRRSTRTHPHPWFGPLTAWQWHWVMASHQGVHRRQIAQIIKSFKDAAT